MTFNLNVKYRLIALLIVLTANSSCTKEEYVTIDSKPCCCRFNPGALSKII